jgi:hypothetical protein
VSRISKVDFEHNRSLFLVKCAVAEAMATPGTPIPKPLERAYYSFGEYRGRAHRGSLSSDACMSLIADGLIEFRNGYRLTATGRAACDAVLADARDRE